MKQGKTSADDDFIELHIFGPMTVRTIERVVIERNKRRQPKKAIIQALRHKLNQWNVPCQEI